MSYNSTRAELKRIVAWLEQHAPEDDEARVLHELRIEMLDRAAAVLSHLIDDQSREPV